MASSLFSYHLEERTTDLYLNAANNLSFWKEVTVVVEHDKLRLLCEENYLNYFSFLSTLYSLGTCLNRAIASALDSLTFSVR